ncbi:RHS repeat domain-containing protein [Chryseobacterium sp. MA9]|uniref:RHS repeat domain-containing protein n=1 Tax=Chryseobacterium sp. MA9 TaxID=2966625 RepID=UPI0021050CCE|nr:RHS repeat-associated core domain-containing protein [Chryseobacterium sp. MA9]UTX50281.1 hypothetical protein KIK00_08495 [Chryseobacterium sp. MA9]
MFDYGWREYMPDLGRWNGIDQLAESYLSTSPYAYVANNPVLMTDPDGRWMDDTGLRDRPLGFMVLHIDLYCHSARMMVCTLMKVQALLIMEITGLHKVLSLIFLRQ